MLNAFFCNTILFYVIVLSVSRCFFFISVQSQEDAQDLDALTLAKSYFDLKEYDRAAYFLKGCCSQKSYFLYMYSRYLVSLYSLHTYTLIFDSFSRKGSLCLGNILTTRDFFFFKSGEKKKDDETVDSLGKILIVFSIYRPPKSFVIKKSIFDSRSVGEGSGTK